MTRNEQHLAWIDGEIFKHQTEIAKLTVAREVVASMPSFAVVRREKEVKPGKKYHPTKAEIKAVRMEILGVLQKAMPPVGAKPIEIINALGIGSGKAERRPYYNALTRMEKNGTVVKENGMYMLPAPSQKQGEAA